MKKSKPSIGVEPTSSSPSGIQQLMIPLGYRGTGAHVLISLHGDGEIIARIIARFGHQAVRGSSTRGGAGALRALIKLGRAGQDLVVNA